MRDDWDDVCALNVAAWSENEQRTFGGLISETTLDPADVQLIQAEVPVGLQRIASAQNQAIDTDKNLNEILASQNHGDCIHGFPTAKEISSQWGFSKNSYSAKVDCLLVTTDTIYIIEMKTRAQRIQGLHDVYEGLGQILMNHDRFEEDYPTVLEKVSVMPLLLAEDSEIDIELIDASFRSRGVGFFDPVRGGMLIPPK